MLFKLSLQNIKKSMKDYAIYFFTLILGVALFYVFNAIESQTAMMEISQSQKEIIQLLTTMLSGVSVFIAVILGFLVIYASRFLMKRRSREFGLYLILGMGKRKISLILFLETVLIGMISLGVGLLIGIGASQLTSLIVADMFEVNLTDYRFVFSSTAMLKTILFFALIYIVVILFNTFMINKCKLIDLFYAGRKSERVRMKNPAVSSFVFVVSVVMLGVAYRNVLVRYAVPDFEKELVVYILMGSLGTFLFFWSVAGLLFQVVSANKSFYFKGLNSFTVRQMSSRMNTNVFSMTIICLMLFITICVLASALTVRNSMNYNIRELAPADIELVKSKALDASLGYSEQQLATTEKSILEFYDEHDLQLTDYLKEYVQFYEYEDPACTLGSTLGERFDAIRNQFLFLKYDTPEMIMSVSDYNKIAKLFGNETFSLEEDEYLVVADFDSMVKLRNQALAAGEEITVFGYRLKPKYDACKEGSVELAANHITVGIFVVPDAVVEGQQCAHEFLAGNYLTDIDEEKAALEEQISQLSQGCYDTEIVPTMNTKRDIRESAVGLGAICAFVGLYIGLIFLISGAAILALKELSESADNMSRFRMIGKLGADEKMLRKALFGQMGIFFLLPMLLACFHSVFGMLFSAKILEIFGTEQLVVSLCMTALILLIIYGGYFIITYYTGRNMLSDEAGSTSAE